MQPGPLLRCPKALCWGVPLRDSIDAPRHARELGTRRLGSMVASLKLLEYALQRLQFLTRLRELSSSGELLILVEVLSCLGNQCVDVARSRWRRG